jgi:hypothetical protein
LDRYNRGKDMKIRLSRYSFVLKVSLKSYLDLGKKPGGFQRAFWDEETIIHINLEISSLNHSELRLADRREDSAR